MAGLGGAFWNRGSAESHKLDRGALACSGDPRQSGPGAVGVNTQYTKQAHLLLVEVVH